MTPFASVALYRRKTGVVFKPPRLERPYDLTQARKAAMRFWAGNASADEILDTVFVIREVDGRLEISARTGSTWIKMAADISRAAREPHLNAAMEELGIDIAAAPPPIPDVLTINGFVYRRDI